MHFDEVHMVQGARAWRGREWREVAELQKTFTSPISTRHFHAFPVPDVSGFDTKAVLLQQEAWQELGARDIRNGNFGEERAERAAWFVHGLTTQVCAISLCHIDSYCVIVCAHACHGHISTPHAISVSICLSLSLYLPLYLPLSLSLSPFWHVGCFLDDFILICLFVFQ